MYRIKEIRMNRGMSQAELSRRANVSRGTIIRLESEPNAETTVGTLKSIADALEVIVPDLFCNKSSTC